MESTTFIHRVYAWMCAGLAITAITSFIVASSQTLADIFLGNQIAFFGLIIAELVLVIYLSRAARKLSATQAGLLFVLYAFLNGLTLSFIFLAYDISSIGNAFLVSAGTFGIMAAYGYFTHKDLTSVGHLAMMGLVGVIIAYVANIFIGSAQANIVISFIGVLVFVGLTAYDMQRIKSMQAQPVIGALILYLDLINLFLNILNLTGKRR